MGSQVDRRQAGGRVNAGLGTGIKNWPQHMWCWGPGHVVSIVGLGTHCELVDQCHTSIFKNDFVFSLDYKGPDHFYFHANSYARSILYQHPQFKKMILLPVLFGFKMDVTFWK